MADDPYSLLGLTKTASEADIRKAYRKLAKELHPDLNPGDKAAEDKFKKVSAAYKLLSDKEQRARFDRGEIDATGAEKQDHHYYRHYADTDGADRYHSAAGYEDYADISEILSEMFGGRGPGGPGGMGSGGMGSGGMGGRHSFRARGSDARYHLEVDFLDAVTGAKRRITMPDGKALDLSIPAGTRDGDTLRLKGKGARGLGNGPAGDALVTVSVRPHKLFRREGDDIVVELPISIDEAVLGGRIEVPTIGGNVMVTVPKGSKTGDTLRLKDRGVEAKGRAKGSQRVILKVVMPDRIDPELEAFMERWRKDHAYDPRAALRRAS